MAKRTSATMSLFSISLALIAMTPLAEAAAGKANTFAIVGETGASAQQMFLGTEQKVYIVDKTENNIAQVAGHPAWATEYDLTNNSYRSLDIITNSFCAGGNVLANGTWINIGGNQAVTTGGIADNQANVTEGQGPYDDYSGGRTVRMITPCDDDTCVWLEDKFGIPVNRWYPYVENLETGDVIILGGELYGGFVNDPGSNQNNPTYEFWPSRGAPINSTFLADTRPANLYPLSWLLPNGLIFMQANWQTQLLNYTSGEEIALPNITIAQKTYPSSGSTAMLPLTVANNYEVTLLFCGGMTPELDSWNQYAWNITDTPTSSSCVSIQPEQGENATWSNDDNLPENRGMGNFIILPDERLWLGNGVGYGSAGYGWLPWAVNQSFATDPVHRPAYYNASAPAGKRFDNEGLPESTVSRLYHSSATLLADGSIFIAGSNPNADVVNDQNNATYVYKTEYRSEIFYPSYYDHGRPVPSSLPSTLSYGGDSFNFTLPKSSLNGTNIATNLKVAVIRTGFSTHAMNMGMRYLQLRHSFTSNSDGSATIYVAQLEPNPALFQPGPAMLFVTVNGVPSIGQMVMVGNGQIGVQPTAERATLPGTPMSNGTNTSGSPSSSGGSSATGTTGSSSSSGSTSGAVKLGASATLLALAFGLFSLA